MKESCLFNKKYQIPAEHSGDYLKQIKSVLNDYLEDIKNEDIVKQLSAMFFEDSEELFNQANILSEDIINTIENYLNGKTIKANDIFRNRMELMDNYKVKKGNDLVPISLLTLMNPDITIGCYYRIREGVGFSNFREMGHVPFSKRKYCSDGRFSLSGIPALYLGNSILGCWQELNSPNIENIMASRYIIESEVKMHLFDISKDPKNAIMDYFSNLISNCALLISTENLECDELNFLKSIFAKFDITNDFDKIKRESYVRNELLIKRPDLFKYFNEISFAITRVISKYEEKMDKKLFTYVYGGLLTYLHDVVITIISFPLIYSTMMKTDKNDKFIKFHEEYIISKLLSSYLVEYKNSKLGLKYLSTRTPQEALTRKIDRDLYLNYIYFTDISNSDEDYCLRLNELFSLTKPISASDVDSDFEPNMDIYLNPKIYRSKHDYIEYSRTKFYFMEEKLKRYHTNKFKPA